MTRQRKVQAKAAQLSTVPAKAEDVPSTRNTRSKKKSLADILTEFDAYLRSDEHAQWQKEHPVPHPKTITDLDDPTWSCEFDDLLRDQWSRDYLKECECRSAARELIANTGGIVDGIRAIKCNLPPARELLSLTGTVDEAIAYARGNGGPANEDAATESIAASNGSERKPDSVSEDQPDKNGYVANPSDATAYIQASTILSDHTEGLGFRVTAKMLGQIVENYSENRVRWTRPMAKSSGKPHQQRRSVHLADWTHYLRRQRNLLTDSDGWPKDDENEVKRRTAIIRAQKEQEK